jgi:iron complex transport system substrate-binding protein
MRIVSLIASATEIIWALGQGKQMVGRSHECDHPSAVLQLPALTAPKFNLDGPSSEIDRRVREIVRLGLSVYRVDGEALRALRPDLIITQDHCEVCAVSRQDVEAAVRDWTQTDVAIVSLRPTDLSDVFVDIATVAEAISAAAAGQSVVAEMKRRLDGIADRAASLQKPRVAFIEWGEPLMSGGNWMPTLIEIAGGNNLFGLPGGKSEVLAWSEVVAADADVIVIAPCGFTLEQSLAEHAQLQRNPHWSSLKAVREQHVYCGDGNAFFNRPGPRLVETAEILAECLHPTVFKFGHQNRGWRLPSFD